MHPKLAEMAMVCKKLNLPVVIESDKSYPREWLVRGRLRVLLKVPSSGEFLSDEVQNKKTLMRKFCEIIPTMGKRAEGEIPKPNAPTAESATVLGGGYGGDGSGVVVQGAPGGAGGQAALPSSSGSGGGAPQGLSREEKKEEKRAQKKADKKKKK